MSTMISVRRFRTTFSSVIAADAQTREWLKALDIAQFAEFDRALRNCAHPELFRERLEQIFPNERFKVDDHRAVQETWCDAPVWIENGDER